MGGFYLTLGGTLPNTTCIIFTDSTARRDSSGFGLPEEYLSGFGLPEEYLNIHRAPFRATSTKCNEGSYIAKLCFSGCFYIRPKVARLWYGSGYHEYHYMLRF